MRRTIFLLTGLILILLSSCDKQEYCLDKSFGSSDWKQDSGAFVGNTIRFSSDDSVRIDVPTFNIWNEAAYKYEFNEGCESINMTTPGSNPSFTWNIIKNTGSIIWISSPSGISYFHKL